MSCLKPCPSCQRHIRSTEAVCPFCGAATPEGFEVCAAKVGTGAGAGAATRAAVVFAGALTLAGCPEVGAGKAVPGESAQPGAGGQPAAQPGRAPVNVVPPYSVAPVERPVPDLDGGKTPAGGGEKGR